MSRTASSQVMPSHPNSHPTKSSQVIPIHPKSHIVLSRTLSSQVIPSHPKSSQVIPSHPKVIGNYRTKSDSSWLIPVIASCLILSRQVLPCQLESSQVIPSHPTQVITSDPKSHFKGSQVKSSPSHSKSHIVMSRTASSQVMPSHPNSHPTKSSRFIPKVILS